MEYKLYSNGHLMTIPTSGQSKVIKIYKEYKEEIERLNVLRNNASNNISYQRAREDWLEETNEFIGFQKCLKALSIKVEEVNNKNG